MKRGLTIKSKRAISGYLFILPFIIGFIAFMIAPLFMSLQMTFSQINAETISQNGFQMISNVGYGTSITVGKEISLPDGYRFNEAKLAENTYLIEMENGEAIPASFAWHILKEGGVGMFFATLPNLLGLENYVHALTIEPTYNQLLVDELVKMVTQTLAILVVAFVIALLLNQEFKGRALVRAIFFLPVILSSGVLVNLELNNSLMQGMQDIISEETPFTVTDSMMEILRLTGLGGDLLDVVFELIAEVYDIVMASGIQIIVFLSGLQNVPASLYEAADVEGCTKWEAFWMITFPMVSPLLLVNIIYTIIDFFTKMGNDLVILMDRKLLDLKYDHMSTMYWIYFLVSLALIGACALIISKVVAKDE